MILGLKENEPLMSAFGVLASLHVNPFNPHQKPYKFEVFILISQ